MFERVQEGVIGREMGKITLPGSSVRVHKTVGNVPLRRHGDLRSLHLSFFFFLPQQFLPITRGIINIIPVVLLKEIVHPKLNILSSLTHPYVIPNPSSYFCSGQKENCTGQASKRMQKYEKIELKRIIHAFINLDISHEIIKKRYQDLY